MPFSPDTEAMLRADFRRLVAIPGSVQHQDVAAATAFTGPNSVAAHRMAEEAHLATIYWNTMYGADPEEEEEEE